MLLLLVGLWPFDFFPANNVRWFPDHNGLRFDRYGIVFGKEAVFGPGAAIDFAGSWTLFLQVAPHDEPRDSLPRILSAYDSGGRELLFLAQWRSELILRILQGEKTFRLAYKEIGCHVLPRGKTQSIAVVADNAALRIYANGTLLRTVQPSVMSYLSRRQPHAWLSLGNSPTGESPWRGEILALSIFPQALEASALASEEGRATLRYRFDERHGMTCHGVTRATI